MLSPTPARATSWLPNGRIPAAGDLSHVFGLRSASEFEAECECGVRAIVAPHIRPRMRAIARPGQMLRNTKKRLRLYAGISKVIYIEPYAKSRASVLHPDEISVNRAEPGKVPFLPFVGVGPRRHFDLFSLTLSTGYPIERKKDGKLIPWSRATAAVRLQVKPSTYLQRELLAYATVKGMRSSHG